jgi:hypothetical protein
MRKQTALAGIASLIGVTVIAVALALALWANPARTSKGYPSYVGAQPQGCTAVAPGSWSSICETGSVVSHPTGGHGDLVCKPVAPGAFTEVCTRR